MNFLDFKQQIAKAIADKVGIPFNQLVNSFGIPPSPQLGQLAFSCYSLVKVLKKDPNLIAQELAQSLVIPKVQISSEKAYLNFKLSPGFQRELISPTAESFCDKTIMIEYSQPNTHKEIHVGHLRNLCLGQALVNLKKFSGYSVVSATFPGDLGTHIAKCLWYIKHINTDPIPTEHRGEWLGQMYTLASQKLATPEDEEKIKPIFTQILMEIQNKQGEYYDLWLKTKPWSLDLIQEVYNWARVQFDKTYYESEVDKESVALVQELYQQGKLQLSQGAIGLDLKDSNLGFLLLLKSDGTGLYATKDLLLAKTKTSEYPSLFQSIYVVDQRQSHHFKQVFKALEKLGLMPESVNFHLNYNYVELPSGPISSRAGNIVPVRVVIEKAENTILEKYLKDYDWSEDEKKKISTIVAQGAIKYGMLKVDYSKKIVFDLQDWIKLEGDSGPFIQYTGARIRSLLQKQNYQSGKTNWDLLSSDSEINLIQKLLWFQDVVKESSEAMQPYVLAKYLFELAQSYNQFYHHCSIKDSEIQLKQARLDLSNLTLQILSTGLDLLGIEIPLKM